MVLQMVSGVFVAGVEGACSSIMFSASIRMMTQSIATPAPYTCGTVVPLF